MKSPREIATEYAARIPFPDLDGMTAATIEAAILEALTQDLAMDDQRLFLPVAFVRQQNAVFEDRIAELQGQMGAIRAALNCESGEDAETCARRLYHDLTDARFAATNWQAKAEDYRKRLDEVVQRHTSVKASRGAVEP